MSQVAGRIVVETLVKTMVCENCKGLCVSVQGKPHVCVGPKRWQAGAGQVIVLAKHETTVSVPSAE
jgi:hypothetical protein